MTLPQPFWSSTAPTEWIMSPCHQTVSPGSTAGIGVSAGMSTGCQRSLIGSACPFAAPHRSSSATSSCNARRSRYDIADGIGTVCRTPSVGAMSDSAVQPWNVRKAEHITVDSNSCTSVRYAPSHGSYRSGRPAKTCRKTCWYAGSSQRSIEPESVCGDRPPELELGSRRRTRSGYAVSRVGSNQTRPSDSCFQNPLRKPRTATMFSSSRASICGRDQ